ncbi:ERF family protein [Sinorhizobium psoraleae]|uniref:ERF family protein n=1 Tax=Sinorhizobium psoraleae TaxID=520838 RepID=A0ABT4KBM3_9HYPH|nr:ERF family protein [Sinorhizobium psoraleae]MCZ4089362.1 ERF family protein [Sinorhizobium psoraleae]
MGALAETTTHTAIIEQPARAVVTPMEMLDRAVSSGASVETLTQLMNLQERWEANQARKAFDEAMAAVKANMPKIVKSRKVDFTTSKGRTNYQYEDLASIMSQIGPVLSEHGLSVRYRTSAEPNQPITVTCIISHRLGHSEENTLMAGRDDSGNKNSIQAIGSTVTYLQRYTLKAALGLAAAADDDGGKADETPEDAATITEAQASVIRELIEKAKLDTEVFCKRWQIDEVTAVPMSKFNEVVQSLRMRIKALQEKANEEKNNG